MVKNRTLWLAIFLFVIFFGFRLFFLSGEKKTAEEQIIPVEITNPQIGQIEDKIMLLGDIKGKTEVQVRPKTAGRIEEIFVKEGDEVQEGDKLLSFAAGLSPTDEVYEDMVTFAPVSGIIGIQYVKLGEQVISSPTGINPVFTIYQIDNLKVFSNAPEKYSSSLVPGLTAKIYLDAYPDKIFTGSISSVRPVVDPLTRTIQIEIGISNPERIIKPGMFCRVELSLKKKSDALLIPVDAVLEDGGRYVFVVQNNKAGRRDIITSIKEGEKIEVASGLSSRDRVIIVGQRVVKDGSRIEIKSND